jgi:Anabaena sensory rhodopsin transducer
MIEILVRAGHAPGTGSIDRHPEKFRATDTDYSSVFETDVPIVVRRTRLDSRRAEVSSFRRQHAAMHKDFGSFTNIASRIFYKITMRSPFVFQ